MADAGCPGIISNPDLVGIGARLNFYVTILLAAIIPQSEYTIELLNELYINAVFYGHALLITVLVQTIQGRLDLYHAIFVMHMLVCFSVFQVCGMKTSIVACRYSFRRKITLTFQLLQVLFIFPSWALYVWIKGSGFGAQPQCNHFIKYVLFFVTIRATVYWLRIIFMVFISLTICMSLIALRMILNAPLTESGESVRRVQGRLGWFSHIFCLLSTALLAVYGITHAELIVHRNHPLVHAGENTWGLGQVISVLLLLPIFVELLVAPTKWYSGRSRRKGRAEAQEEAQEEAQVEGHPVELVELNVVQDII